MDELPKMARAQFDEASKRRRAGGAMSGFNERDGKKLLSEYGIPVPAGVLAEGHDELVQACDRLAPPFALKILSSQPIHKTENGAVRLGLRTPEQVLQAASEMRAAWRLDPELIQGFLLEEMAAPGHELVVGTIYDRTFGHMMMVGLGGIFVEIFSDVSFRLCPIEENDAHEMLRELRAFPLLEGARNTKRSNIEAIVDVLMRIGGRGGLIDELGADIDELDINPLIAGPESVVAVDARFVVAQSRHGADATATHETPDFRPLFRPRTIAVAGISRTGESAGGRFVSNLKASGYAGKIYAVHPQASNIDGIDAYPDLASTPEPIDYAYVAVPQASVGKLLGEANGRVRFAQVMSSGFAETDSGKDEQSALLEAARKGGVRLLGPNSLGIYSPRGHVSFIERTSGETGGIGIISQSGGLGVDFVRLGQARGLRFSGVVTLGNSVDLGPNDFLEYFLDDKDTKVIGLYLENVGDGRRFFDLLRNAGTRKPVVLLKGGRTSFGRRAVASHTGALAGNESVWAAVAAQTGCMLVQTMDEMIHQLLLFQTLKARDKQTRRIVLFGNGGGAGVLATDTFAQLGFELAEFGDETSAMLGELNIPHGASLQNPIDIPGSILSRSTPEVIGRIVNTVAADDQVDAVVVHANLPVLTSYRNVDIAQSMVSACIGRNGNGDAHRILVLRTDGTADMEVLRERHRTRAVESGVPVFDDFPQLSTALKGFTRFESRLKGHRTDT